MYQLRDNKGKVYESEELEDVKKVAGDLEPRGGVWKILLILGTAGSAVAAILLI